MKNNPVLIVIVGRKRAGKDTIADMLKATATARVVHVALARAMKLLVAEQLGMPVERLEELKNDQSINVSPYGDATVRKMLEVIGQRMKDMTDDDLFWCRVLARDIDLTKCDHIISDIRFPFEEAFFRKLAELAGVDFLSIKVERDGIEKGTHESEIYVDDIVTDITLQNNGTIDDLRENLALTLTQFVRKKEGEQSEENKNSCIITI